MLKTKISELKEIVLKREQKVFLFSSFDYIDVLPYFTLDLKQYF